MICPYCGKLITYNSFFDVFYCSKCGGFFKQATVMECNDLNKPLANAQKIRSMSDEELAEFLADANAEYCHVGLCKDGETCRICCLNWLHQPAEEDKHD